MTHSELALAEYPDVDAASRHDLLTEGKSIQRQRSAFDSGMAAVSVIFVIQRRDCTKDRDNYDSSRVELQEDLGFFTTEAAAQAKCDGLNNDMLAAYETHEQSWKQQRFTRCLSFFEFSCYEDRTIYEIQRIEKSAS